MGVLVNGAIAALAAVVGTLLAQTFLGAKLAFPAALLFGLAGFFGAGQFFPDAGVASATRAGKRVASEAASLLELEDEAALARQAKKAKKLAAEKAKKAAAELARAAEVAAKLAAKKAEQKKKKKAAVAQPESESEDEEEASPAPAVESEEPKSKSALKKAKKAAKEAAAKLEAEKAAKAAEKAAKKAAKAAAGKVAPVAAAAADTIKSKASAAAAAAAAAADLEGWETIEATKPTKSQQAKAAAPAAPVSGKKKESIPASERELTEDVIIPVKHHALIIGSKGATLNQLQTGSGAKIDMPKRESASAKIQITGTPAQVAVAKNAIESLVERGFSNITHPGTLSDDINIDPKDIGLVLGANGATLRTIQSKTNTRINLPEKGSSSKKVTIVGAKEDVREAKAALKSLVADGFSPLTHEGWVKTEIDFPAEKFGILIGPKGQTIKSIQGNTKTRINLPEKHSQSNVVSVVGLPAGVAQAEKEIRRLLEPPPAPPAPEEEDLATDDAWGQEHTAQGEDALWE